MHIHGVRFTQGLVDQIAAHAEQDYPVEACGVVFGKANGELVRVEPMQNVQDKYHRLDPVAFPRDGKDAFRFDDLEHLRLLEAADKDGLEELVVYHSHCDAGAYFSPEDRAMAVREGMELLPGAIHVVVSVRQGERFDMAAFRYDSREECFVEARVPLKMSAISPPAFPDLLARSMEGREAAKPLPPVGGRLVHRVVTETEAEALRDLAGDRKLGLDGASGDAVRAFSLGLYSPLEGFMEAAEAESVRERGQLLSGLPWWTVVELVRPLAALSHEPSKGDVFGLESAGSLVGVLRLSEVEKGPDGAHSACRLAGAVFGFPIASRFSAAESRAEILRLGHSEVWEGDVRREDFVRTTLPALKLAHPSEWLEAVAAQNRGATHFRTSDARSTQQIGEGLDLLVA